jgi:hypothetical protein
VAKEGAAERDDLAAVAEESEGLLKLRLRNGLAGKEGIHRGYCASMLARREANFHLRGVDFEAEMCDNAAGFIFLGGFLKAKGAEGLVEYPRGFCDTRVWGENGEEIVEVMSHYPAARGLQNPVDGLGE